jgi:tetratricopeptide (TPR) repeat protein
MLEATSKRKESNLSKLFEFLSAQKKYSEEAILKKFADESFSKQLHVTKNHLYEAILKSMRAYNIEKSLDHKLKSMLHDVQFLYDKRLVHQAKTILKRVKNLSEEYEKYTTQLEVLDWEAKILASQFYVGSIEKDIDNISDKYYEVLEKLQNSREYNDLQSKMFNNYYKEGIERKNENYKTNDQIINQFILKDENRALSFKARCCFYNIHSIYNKINNNWEKAYEYRKKLLQLFEESGRISPEEMNMHFAAINNLLPVSLHLGKYKEVEELLAKMRNITQKYPKVKVSEDIEMKIFTHSNIAELSLYVRIGEVDKGIKLIKEITPFIIEHENKIRKFPLLHLYYNISYFYFSIGKYSESIQWMNNILNDNSLKSVEDIHSSSHILTMILQFEQGRDELLSYLARSTHRYLNKLEGLYKFETILLSFLKKNTTTKTKKDLHKNFKKLREQLQQIRYEPGERNALSTIDLTAWVDSKIEGIPFYEVMRRRK